MTSSVKYLRNESSDKPETEIGFTPPSSYERLWSIRLALILEFGLILRIHYFEVKSAYFQNFQSKISKIYHFFVRKIPF